MKLLKRSGLSVVLVAMGSVIAVGCNDSTTSACLSACEHLLACETAAAIDAGFDSPPDAGAYCQDGCNSAADAGYGGCKNPGGLYDCVSGLSCQDLLDNPGHEGPPPAFANCATKAECPLF